MNPEDVQALLENAMADCQFQVESDGSHFNIVAVGEFLRESVQYSVSRPSMRC